MSRLLDYHMVKVVASVASVSILKKLLSKHMLEETSMNVDGKLFSLQMINTVHYLVLFNLFNISKNFSRDQLTLYERGFLSIGGETVEYVLQWQMNDS